MTESIESSDAAGSDILPTGFEVGVRNGNVSPATWSRWSEADRSAAPRS